MSLSLDAKTSAAIQHYTDFYLATGIYDLSANKAGTLEIPLDVRAALKAQATVNPPASK